MDKDEAIITYGVSFFKSKTESATSSTGIGFRAQRLVTRLLDRDWSEATATFVLIQVLSSDIVLTPIRLRSAS